MYRIFTGFLIVLMAACGGKTSENQIVDVEGYTLYLIRHAEKANDGTNDPPLNELGQKRAHQLRDLLADKAIQNIYSTPYKRTQETVSPLAEKLGLNVQNYTPHDTAFVEKILLEKKKTALIVGHSNTIPSLVNQILGKKKYAQLEEMEYDKLFSIEINGEVLSDTIIAF